MAKIGRIRAMTLHAAIAADGNVLSEANGLMTKLLPRQP
jgi:hypothetical protein